MPSASSGSRNGSAGGARPTEPSLFDELSPLDAGGDDQPGAGRSSPSEPEPPKRDATGRVPATVGGARSERRRVVRVLPDEPAIVKTFDYLVPEAFGDQVRVGARVRIALGPRRVGGWIVATDVEPVPGRDLRPLAKMSGYGPPADLIDLAHWAAWRWAGRPATFLRTASPDRLVTALPTPPRRRPPTPEAHAPEGLRPPPTAPGTAPPDLGADESDRGEPHAGSPLPAMPAANDAVAASPPGDGGLQRPRSPASGASSRVTGRHASTSGRSAGSESLAREAFVEGRTVVRLPPAADPYAVVRTAAEMGNALVVCPNMRLAAGIGRRLRRDGIPAAMHPRDWALGAAGATVVGTRAAAWAPVAGLTAVVVLDEHDEAHAQEQAPTWHARDVVAERARRAGVPCALVSPCPSLEALGWGRLLTLSRREERDGWPVVDVVDRRDDDPRTGLFSPALVERLRGGGRVLCVLNRTGRARLLACRACGDLAHCERCEAAVTQPGEDELVCPRCGATRPIVCTSCGSTRFKLLRQGVSRVREELEALVGEPVGEVTGSARQSARRQGDEHQDGGGSVPPEELRRRVVVGTEAILHQADRADVVAFLDLDQELLAPRYRAAEQALALLVHAARLLGGKAEGGRLVLQTRLPRHEVVQAALHGDPARVAEAEADRRELLRFPPAAALAEVSGAAAEQYVAALRHRASASGVEVLGPADDRWLVRAADHRTLCDVLAATTRPPGRLRIAVDPLRL